MKAKIKNLLLLSLVLICISSCAPLIQAVQPAILETVPISQGTAIGQTITANFNGLQEIRLHLTQGDAGNGFIELSLFDRANKDQLIETSRVPLNQINEPGWYSFSFPPLAHSNQNDYYIELIPSGSGTLEVASGYTESYIDGSLFVDSIPADGQLAFQLGYKNTQVIKGLISEILSWLIISAAAFYLYILPGWLILGLIWKSWGTRHWLEKNGYSVGLSLSIYPLLFLWMSVFHLQLGMWFAILPGLVMILVYIWFKRDQFKTISLRMPSGWCHRYHVPGCRLFS